MEVTKPLFSIGEPELANRRNGILRAINYRDANIERFKKSFDYVTNPGATNMDLQHYSLLSRHNPVEALKAISDRFHKAPDTRLFKHYVFSYGDYWVEEKAMMELTEIVMDHLSKSGMFPSMFALHTNTKHPHSHALLCCTSLIDGHQFSQSPAELEQLKDYYDKVAATKKFPLLLRKKNKGTIQKKEGITIKTEEVLTGGSNNTNMMYYVPQNAMYRAVNRVNFPDSAVPDKLCNSVSPQSYNSPETVETIPVIQQDLSLTKIWDDYRNDCKEAFFTGVKIGLELK